MTTHSCHCEEDDRSTRQSIVFADANGECGSLSGSQWIATGLRPRDDKVEGKNALAMTKVGAREDKMGMACDNQGCEARPLLISIANAKLGFAGHPRT